MLLYKLVNDKITKTKINDDFNFDLTCDVLCVGGGCAGTYASQRSAIFGAKVILIENENSVGGMHLNGNVHGYYYGFKGGSFEEADKKAQELSEYFMDSAVKDCKKIVYTKEIENSGVELMCNCTPIGVYMQENKVVGLCVCDGKKVINVSSKMVIDATSEGFVLKTFYKKYRFGRPVDNKTAPYSVISNYVWNDIRCGVNKDAGHVNQYDKEDFSKKLLLSHKDAQETIKKDNFLSLAQVLGVREGISYLGEETLNYSNILLQRQPKKPLFYAFSDLDRHGNDRAIDQELFQNWWVVSNHATVTMPIAVPMGAVVPKGIKGFVTAGRCFSTDSYSQSAVRMVRDMFRMGECVGVACALAVKDDVDFMNVDYSEYLKIVKELNCFGDASLGFAFSSPSNKVPYTPINFDFESNLSRLETCTPAPAIWSCFINTNKKGCKSTVYNKMVNANTTLEKYNCAIALGIMKDKRALPILREIVANRDCFYYTDCRRSNSFRSAVALCLLGRLGDKSDVSTLESIVFDKKEIEREIYHTLEPNYLYYKLNDRNFVFYDMWTHASASLVKIYKREKLDVKSLNKRFIDVYNEGFVAKTIAPNQQSHQPSYAEIENFILHLIKKTSK